MLRPWMRVGGLGLCLTHNLGQGGGNVGENSTHSNYYFCMDVVNNISFIKFELIGFSFVTQGIFFTHDFNARNARNNLVSRVVRKLTQDSSFTGIEYWRQSIVRVI